MRTVLPMWYDFEVILFKSSSMFNILKSEEKIKNIFISSFYYIVDIFCVWLHKSDFLMAIVAQVIDVASCFTMKYVNIIWQVLNTLGCVLNVCVLTFQKICFNYHVSIFLFNSHWRGIKPINKTFCSSVLFCRKKSIYQDTFVKNEVSTYQELDLSGSVYQNTTRRWQTFPYLLNTKLVFWIRMLQLVYVLYEEHGKYDENEEDALLMYRYPYFYKEGTILTGGIKFPW